MAYAVPKSGDLTHSVNYRPIAISLLSCISKVAERIFLDGLQAILSDKDIIIPQQFGFRAKHSATHRSYFKFVVGFAFEASTNSEKQLGRALFLDVAKVHDKVWHKGLIFKVIFYLLPDAMIHFFYNPLRPSLCRQLVNTYSTTSKYFSI